MAHVHGSDAAILYGGKCGAVFLHRDNLIFFGSVLFAAFMPIYATGRAWTGSADPPQREPSEWLTEGDRDELADALITVEHGPGWIAGCVWEDRGEDVADVVTVPGEATRHRATTATGRVMTFARVEGIAVTARYAQLEGPGFFCWVPEPR